MLNSNGDICDVLKRSLNQGDLVGYATAFWSTASVKPAIFLGNNFTKKGGIHRVLPFKLLTTSYNDTTVTNEIKEINISSTKCLIKLDTQSTPEMEEMEELVAFYEKEKNGI